MSILDGITWSQVEHKPDPDGLPVATHTGVLEIQGHRLRCYRLDDGRDVINQDDFVAFFGDALPITAGRTSKETP